MTEKRQKWTVLVETEIGVITLVGYGETARKGRKSACDGLSGVKRVVGVMLHSSSINKSRGQYNG